MLKDQIIWIGIDVGKNDSVCAIDWLDDKELSGDNGLTSLPITAIQNTHKGVELLFNWLAANKNYIEERLHPLRKVVYRFVMEPTGCYSNRLIKKLKAKKQDVYIAVVNPAKMPAFKRLIDIDTKTDKLDAQCLARFGTMQKPHARFEFPEDYASLRRLTTMRSRLVKIVSVFKNGLEDLDDPAERLFFQSPLDSVNAQVNTLDGKIIAHVKQYPRLQERVSWLDSIPGVGMVTASTILAEYGPEERFSNISQVVSFAGMNPKNKFSGKSVKSARLSKQGSPVIRQVLYMASLTAQPRIPLLDEFSKRLTKLTLMQKRCAVMRKLLTICWSVLCSKKNYMEYQPSTKKLVSYDKPRKTKRQSKLENEEKSFLTKKNTVLT